MFYRSVKLIEQPSILGFLIFIQLNIYFNVHFSKYPAFGNIFKCRIKNTTNNKMQTNTVMHLRLNVPFKSSKYQQQVIIRFWRVFPLLQLFYNSYDGISHLQPSLYNSSFINCPLPLPLSCDTKNCYCSCLPKTKRKRK